MSAGATGSGSGRVLVTGAGGQLGQALRASVNTWKPNDTEVVFVTRAQMDLADPASVRRVVEEVAPRLIVNAAAYTAVDRAETDAATATAVNAEAPGILADYVARTAGALIHVSTDYVFDGTASVPYREEDTTRPLGVYGASKLGGEEAVRASGAAHWILRTSWVYSAEGANFLKTMVRLAETRDAVSVVADQRGAPIDALRLATVIGTMLHGDGRPPAGVRRPLDALVERVASMSGTYHATAGGVTTWHEYARYVIEGLHRRRPGGWKLSPDAVAPTDTAHYPTPARRPLYSVLDHRKLIETFGIVPPAWRLDVDACLDRLLGGVDGVDPACARPDH